MNVFNLVVVVVILMISLIGRSQENYYFSPTDVIVEFPENRLYVAGKTGHEIRSYDLNDTQKYQSCSTTLPPKAIVVNNQDLLVVTSWSEGELLILDKNTLEQKSAVQIGHGACDLAMDQERQRVYTANQYSDDISIVDLQTSQETGRIKVLRQPTQVVLSSDGQYLFAANFLTAGRADADTVTSEVSIIDLTSEKVIKNIPLANGSNALRGMALSKDGHYLFISHNLGRFQVPTTQLEQGWMNTSALSVIDAVNLEFLATVLLDEPENGAAGSWGIECTDKHIFVAHSGTHDYSTIDYPAFIEKLDKTEDKESLSYDLRFLSGIRTRTGVTGNGPRVITSAGNQLFAANYFSDVIDIIDLENPVTSKFKQLILNEITEIDQVRQGEIYFNDASYCFQGWQSCNGCHPSEARTDGLNWDLLNDGMGNPKNCKSMLLAHETPPSMITGIRPNAETAVRAGFRHIQFVSIEEEHAAAVDAYLKSLKAVPSPFLVNGTLSEKAQKGKEVFAKSGCIYCHNGNWYTDMKKHEIGRQGEYDHQNSWDTPTLIETWRTGPYLHDGRSATMKEVFTVEKHGLRNELPEEEIEQLVEYVLSL